MSRPGRTALWQNLLRDNQKPASALDAVISVILPNGTNGTHLSATHPSRSSRCPELASSYYLCHYRPTSACFCHRLYTSARRLPAAPACPPLQPARRLLGLLGLLGHLPAALPPARCSACSACSAAPASQPAAPAAPACPLLQPARRSARRSACSACSAALPLCLLQSACLQKKRDFEKSRFFIIRFGPSSAPPRLSARQSRKPSRTSCSRILAQSATGCFSPSMNRSGHPRLQSSM